MLEPERLHASYAYAGTSGSQRSQRMSGRRVVDLVQCEPLYYRYSIVAEILNCLKKHGQRLDAELAKETGVPLAKVASISQKQLLRAR